MEKKKLMPNSRKRLVSLVIIGGSAGSTDILFQLIPSLPQDYPVPVVVVTHRPNHTETSLVDLLQKVSVIKVKEADEKEKIEPGTVYIAPADYHLLIENDRTFSLDAGQKVLYSRPSIDVTFDCAAEVYGSSAIGIILSGASEDGAMGLEQIGTSGGVTIVQKPETAQSDYMPLAAIKRTNIDHVMTITAITEALLKLA